VKVLYIAPQYPNDNENAAQVRSNILLPLLNDKVSLKVVGYPASESAASSLDVIPVSVVGGRVRLVLSTLFSMNPRSFFRFNSKSALKAVADTVDEFKPDIVHLDTIASLVHVKNLGDCKIVVQLHDCKSKVLRSQISSTSGAFRKLDLFLQYVKTISIEKKLYSLANRVLVDSNTDSIELKKINRKNRVDIFPVGFDKTIYNMHGPKESRVSNPGIIFTGSMSSLPTVEASLFLIEKVMPKVWEKYPRLNLYLVGANPVKRLLVKAKQDSRVHITGFVKDLAAYLRSATVYVCPLTIGSGMKTRTIEALACGCPLVSSSDGVEGLNTKGVEGPLWMQADSLDEYVECIMKILADNPMAQEMGRNGAKFAVDNYSWQSLTSSLVDIYKLVISD